MKLLSVAALSFVAAADVPVFSSNDDYDEINLNIRLLQNNGTVNVTTYAMSGEMTTKYTSAGDGKAVCAAVKGSTEKTLVSTLSSSSATVDSCGEHLLDRHISNVKMFCILSYRVTIFSALYSL